MKEKLTVTMLAPKYAAQFRCLGSDCPDTCCAGWRVFIDKETFQAYRRVTHPALKPLLQTHLSQLDRQSYPQHGALGLRPDDRHCALHAPDGRCLVQQHLGEDALSDTCYIYPRHVTRYGERFELSLTLSCPEAARLALTQDDAFEFVSTEAGTRPSATSTVAADRGFDLPAMDEVRALTIQLFQTEGLSNTERLAVLGWLCSQLDALVASNTQHQLPTLLRELIDLVESGALQQLVGQLSQQSVLSAHVFSILFASTSHPQGKPTRHQALLEQVRQGLGLDAQGHAAPAAFETAYLRGLGLLQAEGAALPEKVLARYLLNELLRESFPWRAPSAMLHYRRLLIRFGILRLMLAGLAAAHGRALDEMQMVEAVQVFSRLYQHNDTFASRAENILSGADWDQLGRLYTLLR